MTNNIKNNKVNYDEIRVLLLDKTFRNKIRNNPTKHAQSLGYDKDSSAKYVVKTNTKQILYVILPTALNNQDMLELQAAGEGVGVGTASSTGSVGTIGTAVGSTISTVSSAGSVGTAGSVKF